MSQSSPMTWCLLAVIRFLIFIEGYKFHCSFHCSFFNLMLTVTCPIPLYPVFLGDRELSHLTPTGVVTFCPCLWSRINFFPPVLGKRIWLQPPEGGILSSLGQGTTTAVRMQPGIHQEQAPTDLGVFGRDLPPPIVRCIPTLFTWKSHQCFIQVRVNIPFLVSRLESGK